MKNYKKVIWECLNCHRRHESYSNQRWNMQVCECGKSGYDLEEYYSRTMGKLKVIKIEEINDETS